MAYSIKKVLDEINKKGVIYLDGVSHDTTDTPEVENDTELANYFNILCDYTKENIEIKSNYEYLNYFLFDHNHHDNKTDVTVSFVTVDGASEGVELIKGEEV